MFLYLKRTFFLGGVAVLFGIMMSACRSTRSPIPPTTASVPSPQKVPNPPAQSVGQIVMGGTLEGASDFEI